MCPGRPSAFVRSPWPRDRPSASAQREPVSKLLELLVCELRVVGPLSLAVLDEPYDGFHMPKGREAAFGHIAAQEALPRGPEAVDAAEPSDHSFADGKHLPLRPRSFQLRELPVDSPSILPRFTGLPAQALGRGMAGAALEDPGLAVGPPSPEFRGLLGQAALAADEE